MALRRIYVWALLAGFLCLLALSHNTIFLFAPKGEKNMSVLPGFLCEEEEHTTVSGNFFILRSTATGYTSAKAFAFLDRR